MSGVHMIRAGLRRRCSWRYLPGALLFRLPVRRPRATRGARCRRARVLAGDAQRRRGRSRVVLALAALGAYRFDRLLIVNAILSRRWSSSRPRRGCSIAAQRQADPWTVAAAARARRARRLARFLPPSEYIIGGKDPGIYINEGIQIAQRGTLVDSRSGRRRGARRYARDLFFPTYRRSRYVRACGSWASSSRDPRRGDGRRLSSRTSSRRRSRSATASTGSPARGWPWRLWAILGLLAVYFAGARLVGPAAAFAAARAARAQRHRGLVRALPERGDRRCRRCCSRRCSPSRARTRTTTRSSRRSRACCSACCCSLRFDALLVAAARRRHAGADVDRDRQRGRAWAFWSRSLIGLRARRWPTCTGPMRSYLITPIRLHRLPCRAA